MTAPYLAIDLFIFKVVIVNDNHAVNGVHVTVKPIHKVPLTQIDRYLPCVNPQTHNYTQVYPGDSQPCRTRGIDDHYYDSLPFGDVFLKTFTATTCKASRNTKGIMVVTFFNLFPRKPGPHE